MACAYIRVTLALCAAPGLGVLSRRTISLSASLSPDAEIRAASCITVGETARRTGAGDVDGDLPLIGLPFSSGRLSLTGCCCLGGDGLGFLATGGGGCTASTTGFTGANGLGAMPTVLVFFTGGSGSAGRTGTASSSSSSSLSVASLTTGSLSVSLSEEETLFCFL